MAYVIQMRRGSYTDFDPQEMKPGELAVVLSNDPIGNGKALYFCGAAGTVHRLVTYDDMVDEINSIVDDIIDTITEDIEPSVTRAEQAASRAETAATNAETSAEQAAELYAVYDTNNDGNLTIKLGNGGLN